MPLFGRTSRTLGSSTFKLFDFTPIGGLVMFIGVVFVALFGRLLLPKKRAEHVRHVSQRSRRSHLPAFLRGRLCSDGLCPGLGVLPPGRTCEKGSGLSVGSQLHLPNAARVRMTLERVKKRVTISRGSFQEVRS